MKGTWNSSTPREATTFIFWGYSLYFWGLKPSFFMVCGVQGYKVLFLIPRDSVGGEEASWKFIHYGFSMVFPGLPVSAIVPNVSCWNILVSTAWHFKMNKTSLDKRQTKTPTESCLIFEDLHQGKCTYTMYPNITCWWKVSSFHCLMFYVKLAGLAVFRIMHIMISLHGVEYAQILSDWRVV